MVFVLFYLPLGHHPIYKFNLGHTTVDTVPFKSKETKKTRIALEGSMEIISLPEDGFREEGARRRWGAGGSPVREGGTVKKSEIRPTVVLEKDEPEFSTWYREEQQVEPLDNIKAELRDHEAEKVEEDSVPEEALNQEVSERSVPMRESPLLSSRRDATPLQGKSRPADEEVSGSSSIQEVLVLEKSTREGKDLRPTHAEQTGAAVSLVAVAHEESQEEEQSVKAVPPTKKTSQRPPKAGSGPKEDSLTKEGKVSPTGLSQSPPQGLLSEEGPPPESPAPLAQKIATEEETATPSPPSRDDRKGKKRAENQKEEETPQRGILSF